MSECLDKSQVLEILNGLIDEIYPTDVFPLLTETDRAHLKIVEAQYPNLISRISTEGSRRAFKIASKRISEIEE